MQPQTKLMLPDVRLDKINRLTNFLIIRKAIWPQQWAYTHTHTHKHKRVPVRAHFANISSFQG
jgi:hypothetical protein